MNKYLVIREYISSYPESILFKKGEIVKAGKEYTDNPNWKNWIWCEGKNNNKAWVPKQFLIVENNNCKLNTDFDAMEISARAGEQLVSLEEINGFAKVRNKKGVVGWIPLDHLEFIENL